MTDKLRLVANNTRSWEWESGPRRQPKPPRERLGPLRPKENGPDARDQSYHKAREIHYVGLLNERLTRG
jgi:hypothetical protein